MCQFFREKTSGPFPFPANGDMAVPCLTMETESQCGGKIQIRNRHRTVPLYIHVLYVHTYIVSEFIGSRWWNGLQIRPRYNERTSSI